MLVYSPWPTDPELYFCDPTKAEHTPTLLEELQLSMTCQQHTYLSPAPNSFSACEFVDCNKVVEDDRVSLGETAEADDPQTRVSPSTVHPLNISTMESSIVTETHVKNPKTLGRSAADGQHWVSRRLNGPDLHWRTQSVHSPAAREVITEINSELKETHDALMECLYATTDPKVREETKANKIDDQYWWTPSVEELRGPCTENNDKERSYGGEVENAKLTNDQIDVGVSGTTITHLRGGGVQEFFGLTGRPKKPSSAPRRPQLISRPSEALGGVGNQGPSDASTGCPAQTLQPTRTLPMGTQGSRLQQLQRSNMLRPPSVLSIDGSHSFSGYDKTASIVPEGSVASYSMGFQSQLSATYELEASKKAQVPITDFSQVQTSTLHEGRRPPVYGEPLPGHFDKLVATARNAQSPVELPTTDSQNSLEVGSHNLVPSPGAAGTEFPTSEKESETTAPAPKLGSPMESPIKNTWRNFSRPPTIGSTASTGFRAEEPITIADPQEDPQKMFFAPKGHVGPIRITSDSLQSSRQFLAPNHAALSPLSQLESRNAETKISEMNTAVPSNTYRSSWLKADVDYMAADRSHRSLWNGGDYLSIAPGDSPSEVSAVRAEQAALRQRAGHRLIAGITRNPADETVDGHDPRAKMESEDRFREALRRMWSTHQSRMRFINEDTMKTGEEKKAAAKEEQRYLELEIGQASTDTGFEQLHEPWQKDELVNHLFGTQPKPSKAPSFLRKTNKVMTWILAVPDDPELKTHSSRKPKVPFSRANAVFSSFQKNRTSMSESARAGPSHSHGLEAQQGREQGKAAPPPDARRQFHFAPVPAVHGKTMHQVSFETLGDNSEAAFGQLKTGKVNYKPSVTSSETGWPTQSQAGGKE